MDSVRQTAEPGSRRGASVSPPAFPDSHSNALVLTVAHRVRVIKEESMSLSIAVTAIIFAIEINHSRLTAFTIFTSL